MEVRSRSQNPYLEDNNNSEEGFYVKSPAKKAIARESVGLCRATLRLFKGQASTAAYLFIPVFISLLWIVLCLVTTRSPGMTLEERLSQKHIRDAFESTLYEESMIEISHEHHDPISLPEGQKLNVVIAMPFLDLNPLGATEYISTLEWIVTYSTVPLTFHVITNTDSIEYVNRVFDRVNMSASVEFDTDILTLTQLMDVSLTEICPKMTLNEDFCDILMGKMTPMLFPYLFPKLDHAVYIDRNLMFQEDIGLLYNVVEKLKRGKSAIALAPEQTNLYMRAFSGWQRVNPTTKLGRPPPDGKPGYNPDLIVMDLEKLRASNSYKTYFNEKRLNKLVQNYFYHSTSGDILSLGDILNLMAADWESLVLPLGCEWNRNAKMSTDLLEKKFNICPDVHHIRVWNGTPNMERIAQEKGRNVSVGKKRLHEMEDEL